jgi:hypothetical protein
MNVLLTSVPRLEAPSPLRWSSSSNQRMYAVLLRLRQRIPDAQSSGVLGQFDFHLAAAVGDDGYGPLVRMQSAVDDHSSGVLCSS